MQVNKVTQNGATSLHYACHSSYLDVVMTLIAAKANLFLKTIKSDTQLDLATTDDIRQYIIKRCYQYVNPTKAKKHR